MTFVFLLEEPSMREMLKGLLPRILSPMPAIRYVVFEGKQDLDKNIVRRIRSWRTPNTFFVVMRDQDASDCLDLKHALADKCKRAGRPDALIRIVCRELEGWYFGDLSAVERGLGVRHLVRYANKKKYRIPDEIHAPSEELTKITRGAYQKMSGSRNIGRELLPSCNRSHSFKMFIDGVQKIISAADLM